MKQQPLKMTHRLEIWNGTQYQKTYAFSDGTREMHNNCIRALFRGHDDGIMPDPDRVTYRIVLKDSDRPLKPKRVNWATSTRVTMSDSISMEAQAQATAEHYQRLREASDETLLPVHVFPVKPSGRGVASEFRLLLARILTKQAPMTRGVLWSKTIDQTRRILESRLVDVGFRFIEVDLEDYS